MWVKIPKTALSFKTKRVVGAWPGNFIHSERILMKIFSLIFFLDI